MSAYNESQSSTSAIHHVGVNFNLNHMISSPTTSRSGLESDMNIMRRGQVFMANSTCPETNVARYAESCNMSVRAHPEDKTIFEMDHSATVSKDIGIFLNDTKLFDYCIKVRKPSPVYTNQAIFVSDSLSPTEDKNEVSYETFRVHKIILAARCTYFNTLFCSGNWKESDKNFSESKYDFFESECMKIFLEYLYTGKMKMELRTIIGVLRIASFYSMPIIMESCKSIMDSDFFTALDLCHLYKEVRDNDFDGISNYLSELIPKRTTNETICRILKEIWRENDPRDDSDEMMIGAHNLDESRSMAPVRSSKIELCAKHVISFNQEIMSEIISTSDAKSVIEEDEKDLPHKLINKIQKTLPEIYNKEDTFEELIKLPKSALIMIFKSDKSCAPELMFFNILLKISNLYNPITKHYPLSLNRFNKSSVDGTCNDDNHITINELEEEKEEEEEIPYNRNKQIQDLNNKDPLNYSESRSEGEEDNEEEKSCKLDATISERTNSCIQIDPKMSIKELIPHVRLSLINRKSLITEIRESRYFSDDSIFESLVFQEIPDRNPEFKTEKRFRRRGFKVDYDLVHEDIKVENTYDNRRTTIFKRIKKSQLNELKYVTATHSEPLPLHGIHYIEVKIMPSQNANASSKIFIGLCNPNETSSLEDTHKDKSALLYYTYDAFFWSNGAHVPPTIGNRYIRIRSSLNGGDILKIAVDFSLAKSFQSFWKDQEENQTQSNDNRGTFSYPFNMHMFNRNVQPLNNVNEEHGIRFRSRDNLNLFFNDNSEPIFFNSPCKIYYALNDGDFSEGVDINLMSLDSAPIHFAVSLLEIGQQVECSRCVYFDSIESIPNQPFLLDRNESRVKASHRSVSTSYLNARNASENSNLLNE